MRTYVKSVTKKAQTALKTQKKRTEAMQSARQKFARSRIAMFFQNSPRNEQGPNLYLATETSFRQDMITTSFDEQWAKPISRAKSAESQ